MTRPNRSIEGFSRADLLVVLAVLLVLALVKFSALAGARQPGQRAVCQNNLRQLGVAVLMYSAEHSDQLPPRTKNPLWTIGLQQYYNDTNFLVCPSDGHRGFDSSGPPDYPHSYVMNAWNDYFLTNLTATQWRVYMDQVSSKWGLPESAIGQPSETIVFGEKYEGEADHYFDLFAPEYLQFGNDFEILDEERHSSFAPGKPGGANYAFADGSARFLYSGNALAPTNLWAVLPEWRNATNVSLNLGN